MQASIKVASMPSRQRRVNERRTFSLKTVFYGLVLARRRHARRDTDHLTAPMDWYSPRLFALALGIILFSVLDAVLTLHLLSNGASEANPVMAFFLQHGVWSFVSAKMALTAVPLLLLTALSNYALFNRIRIATLFPLLLLSYHVLIVYEAVLISGIWH